MKAKINGKWVNLEYNEGSNTYKIVTPEPYNREDFKPDFIINENIEDYAFGIHEGENFTYCEHERQTIKKISQDYRIQENEVYKLFDFVKRELPSIQNKDLTKAEIKDIKAFIEGIKTIKGVSFAGDNFTIKIKDSELIESLVKVVLRRYNFADIEGNKSFKKLVAQTLYNQLTDTLKQNDYDSKIIIGRIFGLYHIALVNDPILTKKEHEIQHPGDNYLNYLERHIRSFLTD